MQAMILLPEWQCHTCTEGQQAARGCNSEATQPAEFHGEKLLRCPRRVLLDRPRYFNELFWLHSNYSSGILPESGGLENQPHKLMASIRTLIRARQEADDEKENREKRRKAFRERAASVLNT